MNQETVLNSFSDLLKAIQESVERRKNDGVLQADSALWRRRKSLQVDSDQFGPRISRFRNEYLEKPDWHRAIEGVRAEIENLPEFQKFEAVFGDSLENSSQRFRRSLPSLIQIAIQRDQMEASALLEFLLAEIQGGRSDAWSECELFGLALESERIRLSFPEKELIFRKFTVEDFEREYPDFSHSREIMALQPDCILRIEGKAQYAYHLQIEAEKALAVLRLLRASPFRLGRQSFGSKNPFSWLSGSSVQTSAQSLSENKLILRDGSAGQFERLWRSIEAKMPSELMQNGEQHPDAWRIAVGRYGESVSSPHPVERRIAYAIMGLEALYLRSDERNELQYRLGMRIAKVEMLLGGGPDSVKRDIKEAYNVRSTYVHGGLLSAKEKSRLERNVGTSCADFGARIVDVLRSRILLLLLSGQAKEDHIAKVEDSFLSSAAEDELKSCVLPFREFVSMHL